MLNRILSFFVFLFLFGCGQTFNSHSDDASLGSSNIDSTSAAGIRLQTAYDIVVDKCVNCHTSTIHNAWSGYQTDQAWIDSGMVVAGDATNSKLIYRLKNVGGNMPPTGPQLSDAEYQSLLEWISQM